MRPHLEVDRKRVFVPRWKIEPASTRCASGLIWFVERPSGAWESAGCVCHHPGPLRPNREPMLVTPRTTWTAGSPCRHCGSQQTTWKPMGSMLWAHCRSCNKST